MTADLSPAIVAERLAGLRRRVRPMTTDEARALLETRRSETLDAGAARRLRELRALLELTEHLRTAIPR